VEEVRLLADRVLKALSDPFAIGDRQIQIGASIGLALSTGEKSSVTLLQEADAAMYEAKTGGKGRYCISTSAEPPSKPLLRLMDKAV
jgi:GGDEF domain-containing protein